MSLYPRFAGKSPKTICAMMEVVEPRRLLSSSLHDKGSSLHTIGQDLVEVYSQFNSYQKNPSPTLSVAKVVSRANHLLNIQGKSVAIEASASESGQTLAGDLARIGASQIRQYGSNVSALIPFASLGALSSLTSMSSARPIYARNSAGSVNAQSDNAIRSVNARNIYGADGTGVKVGVLSDSFNTSGNGSYAADIASGDLPNDVQILQDFTDPINGTSDEGRAMAQLIYDSAPGASLAFATAYTGQFGFASNISALQTAGAKVIVDDVFYLDEPFFQDGPIAQAVDNVVASGSAYFSAAGNQDRQSYDSTWRSGNFRAGDSIAGGFYGGTTFDFDAGASIDDMNSMILTNGASVAITLQWDEPSSITGGAGSTKDLDFYLLNSAGTQIVASSVDDNINGRPTEILQYTNSTGTSQTFNLMIVSYTPTVPGQIKYIDFDGEAFSLQYGFNSGTLVGHANSATAAGIAAARYTATPAYGTNPPTSEFFSSYGQVPILFDVAGTRLTNSIVRQQPMLTGVDGVDTTFFGQAFDATPAPNFFGTSAAAPTVAAVAALMLQKAPGLTPAQIYIAMKTSALDMDDTTTVGFDSGFDYMTGFGLVRADNALAALTGSVTGQVISDHNSDGILNGNDSPISGVTVFADLNNNSVIDVGETSTTSDLSGNYTLNGLFPNTTVIRQVVPSGYVPTNPSTGTILSNITIGGTTSNIDFYNFAYTINGTTGDETFTVKRNGTMTEIRVGAIPPLIADFAVPTTLLTSGLTINGLAGDDILVMDYSSGNPVPSTGFNWDGGGGIGGDVIDIRGAGSSDQFTLAGGNTVSFSSSTLNYAGTESIRLSAGTFTVTANLNLVDLDISGASTVAGFTTEQNLDQVSVSSGAIFNSNNTNTSAIAMTLNSLIIDSGVVSMAPNGNMSGVAITKSISITGNGWIDLHDNDLIIDYTDSASPYTDIFNYVKSGLFLLEGNGIGIGSTEVDDQTLAGTCLAVVDVGELEGGIPIVSGADVPEKAVVVKYTWFGDSNLDGAVNGSDYALADTGFTSSGTLNGWIFGDYNFDGIVIGDDYALIDTGFIYQTVVL